MSVQHFEQLHLIDGVEIIEVFFRICEKFDLLVALEEKSKIDVIGIHPLGTVNDSVQDFTLLQTFLSGVY